MEGLTKFYGVEILVTEGTRKLLSPEVAVRELDLIAVKGKDQPDVVYEIIRPDGPSAMVKDPEALALFDEGVALYRSREWERTVRHFESLCERVPGDLPSKIYLERSQTFLAAPPPDDWDGVWRFDTK